jgi:hypothetical protein
LKILGYIRTGMEEEWATWEIKREEKGRVDGDQVGRSGKQVAEKGGQSR